MIREKPLIGIVDYQAGNLRSVQKALEKFGARVLISSEKQDLLNSDAIVFPGQGACDSSMQNLKKKSLDEVLIRLIKDQVPFLGVCLGLQLLLENSEEGIEDCLGVIQGNVKKFTPGLKVPHMGWNQVEWRIDHPVFKNIPTNQNFYFVHSYYADLVDNSVVAGVTQYGQEFCSAVTFDNVIATQFHPEKSGSLGLQIYDNFIQFVIGG
ncbi:MAG: imidazole glycerol phosphate synthase subunit HisH [Chloroflexi bacterium]|nr:imidazole glycerol phosphate synthase subunit HisH [Chloroflexota bacterium]|tara:strand:- start:9409 stop:10035 length:627 start_codon:yes stop_codon:yes gene_type:complete